MLRKVEKNAKSKEEALQLAAEELGVSVDELSYKVEREVGKGLMGLLLGKEVIISAWVTAEEEKERKINEIAKKRAKTEEMSDGNPYAPKEAPNAHDYTDVEKRKAKSAAEKAKKAERAEKKKAEAVKAEEKDEKHETKSTGRKYGEVTEKSIEDAKWFATELVHRIGLSDAVIKAENGGDRVSIDVSGDRMGLLIGKRGDTLDAVQYLTSLYVNKEKNSYIRVSVDTENYRSKREETLTRLAKSLESRVVREGKAVMLEPMSPNERRIIHAALQRSSRVETRSVGDEPNRKVVVELRK